jgi:hypothetical protein
VVRSRDARRRSAIANRDVQLCGVGKSDSSRSSAARGEEAGGCGLGRDVQRFREIVRAWGTALDCAGGVTASAVAAGVLYSAQRAAVDGAAQLQAAVPLVRGLRDRRRDVEPGCVQQEYDRLLNQDPAQKFFAQVKATGGGADVCSNLR